MKNPGAHLQIHRDFVSELDADPAAQSPHVYVLAIDGKAQPASVSDDIAPNRFCTGVLRVGATRQPVYVIVKFAGTQVNGSGLDRHEYNGSENRQLDNGPEMAPV